MYVIILFLTRTHESNSCLLFNFQTHWNTYFYIKFKKIKLYASLCQQNKYIIINVILNFS